MYVFWTIVFVYVLYRVIHWLTGKVIREVTRTVTEVLGEDQKDKCDGCRWNGNCLSVCNPSYKE